MQAAVPQDDCPQGSKFELQLAASPVVPGVGKSASDKLVKAAESAANVWQCTNDQSKISSIAMVAETDIRLPKACATGLYLQPTDRCKRANAEARLLQAIYALVCNGAMLHIV